LTVDLFCDRLEQLVNHDSPSDGTEQEWVAERIGEWLSSAGCTLEWVPEPDGPATQLAPGGIDAVRSRSTTAPARVRVTRSSSKSAFTGI